MRGPVIAAHLDALERRARGSAAGAGARDARARRPRLRRAGDGGANAGARFLQDALGRSGTRWPVPWEASRPDGAISWPATTRWSAVHTPGHAPDHLCFWHEERARCFAAIWREGHDRLHSVELTRRPGRLPRVARARDGAAAARLLPAHGPVIDDPRRCCADTSSTGRCASSR